MASHAKSGETFWTKCAQCHTADRGAPHLKKPDANLNGLSGRQSGTATGYSYSAANKNMTTILGESTLPDHHLNQKKNISGKKMDLYGLTNPKEHADLIVYLKEQKKTSPSMPSQPCISKANIFQIQKYIPRSWRKPSAMTHPDLPGGEKEKNTPKIPVNSSNHFLIDSIRSLSTQCQLSKAFKSFSLLQVQCSSSNLLIHPISSILSASTNLKALPQGKQLHAQIISLGHPDDPFLVSRLCSFYSTIGLLHDARTIVEKASTKHAMPWNLLISAYVQNKFWLPSILAYKNMIERGSDVDKFTYSSVIKACGQIGDLDLGRVVHGSIKSRGLELDLFVNNALVSMYAKCGAMNVAKKLFEMMHDKDVVTWNCMISAYSSKGMWNETFQILEKMQLEGYRMNTITWNTVATVNVQKGGHLEALKLIPKMTMAGAFTDSVTLVIGLNSCSRIGDLQLGKEIHGLAVRLHFTEVENVMNTLITMYSRCKQIKYAYSLFCMCSNRSLITWNAMIAGFALEDQEEETFLIFQEMIKSRVQPNNVTVMTLLSLCTRSANLWYGRQLHCLMTKHRFDNDRYLCNSLINMYSKSEMILDSQRIFEMMGDRDGVSYTSMIAGYGMQGKGIEALKLFYEMIGCGIKADGISMLTILSACSHAGLVTQGQMLFEEMVCLYGIVPQMEHYSCMVDLYGKANLLWKADELIHQMPLRPSRAMLLTLLRACRVYGNIELGQRLARRLMEF